LPVHFYEILLVKLKYQHEIQSNWTLIHELKCIRYSLLGFGDLLRYDNGDNYQLPSGQGNEEPEIRVHEGKLKFS